MLCVDKLVLRVACPDYSDPYFDGAREWSHIVRAGDWDAMYKGYGEPIARKSRVWSPAKSSLSKASQHLPHGGHLLVTYGNSNGKAWVWFTFNPAKCRPEDLGAHFSLMLPNGYCGLRERAVVTAADFAFDVDGADFQGHDFIDTALRQAHHAYKKLGTTYLGSPAGRRRMRCYDKAKQLLEKEKVHLGHARLRLEVCVRPHIPLPDLVNLQNPFSHFHVIRRDLLKCADDPRLKELREAESAEAPLQAAFHQMTKGRRKTVLPALAAVRPDWATPQQLWKDADTSLQWEAALLANH